MFYYTYITETLQKHYTNALFGIMMVRTCNSIGPVENGMILFLFVLKYSSPTFQFDPKYDPNKIDSLIQFRHGADIERA